jgi:hypothetical protein
VAVDLIPSGANGVAMFVFVSGPASHGIGKAGSEVGRAVALAASGARSNYA